MGRGKYLTCAIHMHLPPIDKSKIVEKSCFACSRKETISHLPTIPQITYRLLGCVLFDVQIR